MNKSTASATIALPDGGESTPEADDFNAKHCNKAQSKVLRLF